jgi:Domain of unknown function (DUF6379)
MSHAAVMVEEDSLRSSAGGAILLVRPPWMRSLPWSCVERLAITLDGIRADERALRFLVDGSPLTHEELTGRWSTYWFVQDRLPVLLDLEAPLMPGTLAEVSVSIVLRIPNVLVGESTALTSQAEVSKVLTVGLPLAPESGGPTG